MDRFFERVQTSLGNLVEKLEGWLDSLILALPNIMLALIVMVIALISARFVNRYFSKLISRFSKQETVNKLLSSICTAGFVAIMLFLALDILKLDSALQSLLAGAGIAGLAVGLALQDPIVNLFSGVMMSMRQYFNIGDLVDTNGFFGHIQKVSLRTTTIRTLQGQQVIIPNKMVHQNPFTNYTTGRERRVDLECGISYGEDLDHVRDVAIAAIESAIERDTDRPIDFLYTGFGNSSIDFVLRFWLGKNQQSEFMERRSDAIVALKKAFDREGITIPFPIRTLDFGIKGGQKLNEMLDVQEATGRSDS